jgi:hypothetical protein
MRQGILTDGSDFNAREEFAMGTEGIDRQQQKVTEFMRLMPLTLEIAGLGQAESGRHFTEDQMSARLTSIRTAYKLARQLILEIAK